jgi:hypothetical protein
MLQTRLSESGQTSLAQEIQAGLDALDPRYRELPAFERGLVPGASSDRRGPPARRGG